MMDLGEIMAIGTVKIELAGGGWPVIAALIDADGSAAHPFPPRLMDPRGPARDLADAVHLIGMLHARFPGLVELARNNAAHPEAAAWLEQAAGAFANERAYLTRLMSAAGPLPSTPGQAESDAAVAGQCHALDMLAKSDRAGCATGGAMALVLDWIEVRRVLDVAADRFGAAVVPMMLPDIDVTAAAVANFAPSPPLERALAFGAQQVMAQQRGLWTLLEARASARDDN